MAITITEALSNVKTLNARISKEINGASFITSHVVGKIPTGYATKEDFVSKATSTLKSVKDLIVRRNALKSAIVASNAITKVTISKKEYTVASAIERKSSISLEKELLAKLTSQYNMVTKLVETAQTRAQSNLDSLIQTTFGKDAKVSPDDIKPMTEAFWSKNETVVLDPLKLRETIESLNNDISEFESAVDIALTISNSTTSVEI